MQIKEIINFDKEIKEDYSYKLIVIGNSGIGKSNFILRVLGKDFMTDSPTTLGVELHSKYFSIIKNNNDLKDEKIVKINIWDTAGQERYKSITSGYYKGTKGVFVLYDLTRQETFESIDDWVKDINNYCQIKPIIMIVGTKNDLKNLRMVDELKQKSLSNIYSKIILII